jgi:hypothetical protein
MSPIHPETMRGAHAKVDAPDLLGFTSPTDHKLVGWHKSLGRFRRASFSEDQLDISIEELAWIDPFKFAHVFLLHNFLFYPGSHLPENTPVRTLQSVQTGGMSRPP